jgi:hypothetical protein
MRLPLETHAFVFMPWRSPRPAHEQDLSHTTRSAPKYKVNSSASTSLQFVRQPFFIKPLMVVELEEMQQHALSSKLKKQRPVEARGAFGV